MFIFMKCVLKSSVFTFKRGRKSCWRKKSWKKRRLVDHFLASNSKPTVFIWEILGSHLSLCVFKQREGANYEWFEYRVAFLLDGFSQQWGPEHYQYQVTETLQWNRSTVCRAALLTDALLASFLALRATGEFFFPLRSERRPTFDFRRQCVSYQLTPGLSLKKMDHLHLLDSWRNGVIKTSVAVIWEAFLFP